jgi:patatin-like phospholipase/acyl hydrolase
MTTTNQTTEINSIAAAAPSISPASPTPTIQTSPTGATTTIKVLSIDGGGVRGIIAARIIHEIEIRTNKPISELFDIITGTSTGGLVAATLVKPDPNGKPQYTAKDLVNFYLNDAQKIFSPSLMRKFYTGFGLWGAKYDRSTYDAILLQTFGNTLLSKTLCPLFIPIFSIDNDKPFIASSYFAKQSSRNDFYLKDIAAATSAAPTYFAPVTFKSINDSTSYIGADGGIYANNSELIGITGVYIMHPGLELQNIVLLSIGTGDTPEQNTDTGNDGDIGWLKNKDIIDDMIDAESILAETAITAMLKHNNYFRFQVSLPENLSAMDNSSSENLTALLNASESFISQNSEQIDELCSLLYK